MTLQEIIIKAIKQMGLIFAFIFVSVIIFYTLFYNNSDFQLSLSDSINDAKTYKSTLFSPTDNNDINKSNDI